MLFDLAHVLRQYQDIFKQQKLFVLERGQTRIYNSTFKTSYRYVTQQQYTENYIKFRG